MLLLTNTFTGLKLRPIKNFYPLFFLLNKNKVTEILKKILDLLYHNLVVWHWIGTGNLKSKFSNKGRMSHVVASCVCRKNMFYNQTFLKGLSTIISLTFSIASVILALLKAFIAISLSSLRVLYRSTIHFACSGLIV